MGYTRETVAGRGVFSQDTVLLCCFSRHKFLSCMSEQIRLDTRWSLARWVPRGYIAASRFWDGKTVKLKINIDAPCARHIRHTLQCIPLQEWRARDFFRAAHVLIVCGCGETHGP